MIALLYSITASVSITAALTLVFRKQMIKRYGSAVMYALTLVLAIRCVIPYSAQFPNAPRITIKLPRAVFAVWAGGAALFMLYHAVGFIWFGGRVKRCGRVIRGGAARETFERVKAEMFIEKDIDIISLKDVSSPMLSGFFSPVVVLPETDFSEQEYEMIFRHELTHFERRDNFKKLFFTLAVSLQWFNPFAYMIMNEAYQSIECICDEKVTGKESLGFKRDYCLMLLAAGKRASIGAGQPAVSYFSTKNKLKDRISNVLEEKTGRKGVLPVMAVILSVVMLSGMLCSCSVETPQDVKDEMNRIESGVANEKKKDSTSAAEEKPEIPLTAASEATRNAKAELSELAKTNGIFKLGGARAVIPITDSFPVYEMKTKGGISTAQDAYEQYYNLEERFLGFHYPKETLTAVYTREENGEWRSERIKLSEALERGDAPTVIIQLSENGTENGQIEWMAEAPRLWYTKKLNELSERYSGDDTMKPSAFVISNVNISETVYAAGAEEKLSEKYALYEGEMTPNEAFSRFGELISESPYITDEKIRFEPNDVEVRNTDGFNTLWVSLRQYIGGVPMIGVYGAESYDKRAPFGFEGMRMDAAFRASCMFISPESPDIIIFNGLNTEYAPRGEEITRIITLTQAFEALKSKLSNAVVYDVSEIALGNALMTEKDGGADRTLPVWKITLGSASKKLEAAVNAVTGECFVTDVTNVN